MCGIVGYVGPRAATPIVVNGLQRLEYRGYDSAGIAVLENGRIAVRRDVGKLSNLINLLAEQPTQGHLAVGHTRWRPMANLASRMPIPTVMPPAKSSWCRMASSRISASCAIACRPKAWSFVPRPTPR